MKLIDCRQWFKDVGGRYINCNNFSEVFKGDKYYVEYVKYEDRKHINIIGDYDKTDNTFKLVEEFKIAHGIVKYPTVWHYIISQVVMLNLPFSTIYELDSEEELKHVIASLI